MNLKRTTTIALVAAAALLSWSYITSDQIKIRACVAEAPNQPGLINGTAYGSANFRGRWRLISGHRYKAASLTKPLVAHAIRLLIA